MSESPTPPWGESVVLAVAVSLAPSIAGTHTPATSGIHRWLADGGMPRFLAVTPVYRKDGVPTCDDGTYRFDLGLPDELEAARAALARCKGFVSFDPVRDRACLDAAGAFGCPVAQEPREWYSLRALAQCLALPATPAGLANAYELGYPADHVAEVLEPPKGLVGDGGAAAAASVSRLHALLLAGIAAHNGFLSGFERRVERMTLRMNCEGVGVDLHLVRIMAEARRVLLAQYKARFFELTGFNPTQRDLLRGWLRMRGINVESLDKPTMRAIRATVAVGTAAGDPLMQTVAEVLFLYAESGCIMLTKLAVMERYVENGRVRGHLVYHGAHTGRWSAEGVQLHNFPRVGDRMPDGVAMLLDAGKVRSPDRLVEFGYEVGVPPLQYLQTLLRGVLTDSESLAWFDFSQIEARVLALIAGEEELLATFIRGNGGNPNHDIYIVMAAVVLGIDPSEVTREQRNRVGKPAILGCGFGLSQDGAAVHEHFALVPEELARKAVRDYRAAYPGVVRLWGHMADLARLGLAGGEAERDLGGGAWMRVTRVQVAPGVPRVVLEARMGKAPPFRLYYSAKRTETKWAAGHKLVENVVSRMARDCVAHVMLELESQGFVPLHVNHDEPIFRAQEGLEEALPAAFRAAEIAFDLPEGTLWFEFNSALRYSK